MLVGQFQPVDLASIFDFVEPFLNLFLYYRENDVNRHFHEDFTDYFKS